MPLAAFPKCYLDELAVHKTLSVEQWIERAARDLDVDGLEFYWGFVPHEEATALNRIGTLLEEHGLAMPMMCYSPDFTRPDLSDRAKEIAKLTRALEVTALLGGRFCRVLSGQRRPGLARADGLRMVAECIMLALPIAEHCGVVLVLENHYKESYWEFPEFAQKMDVFLELLDAIPDSPWFGVNYDPSNALIAGDDPIALLEAVKDRVVTMHASDRYLEGGTIDDLHALEMDGNVGYASILRHGIVGHGLNDYDAIFSILAGAGFEGWISIEDGQDAAHGMEHLQQSAEFLREKMEAHGLR
jgi:sugar phosphate isomerase/epimerase